MSDLREKIKRNDLQEIIETIIYQETALIDNDPPAAAKEIISICMDAAIEIVSKRYEDHPQSDTTLGVNIGLERAIIAIKSLKNDSTNT